MDILGHFYFGITVLIFTPSGFLKKDSGQARMTARKGLQTCRQANRMAGIEPIWPSYDPI
jgi:hypothetical protein